MPEPVSARTMTQFHVTEHFLLADFICPCCDLVKIVPAFYRHVELLEQLRKKVGFPIAVTSGYRCAAHNRAVGGAPRSWHLLFATDIAPADGNPASLGMLPGAAEALGFTGIGIYDRHVHVDLRPERFHWRG